MRNAPPSHRHARGARIGSGASCLAVGLAAILGGCSSPSVESPPPMTAVPSERVLRAELRALSGEVRVKRAGQQGWTAAADGISLYEDDKVRTAPGATVQLHFTDGAHVILAGDALVAVAERRPAPGRDPSDLTVLRGRVDARLAGADESLSVTTRAATVRAGREIVFQ